jgi:eukaryotic-like serine/threonine-protein kinase
VTPERWSEIQRQLEVALSLTPANRQIFLESIAAKDDELRRELESLLAGETADPAFLSTSAISLLQSSSLESASVANSMLGRILGAYHVTGRLGVGGMGEVYLAARADGNYDQQVAIKIVRPGLRGGEFSSIRFRNERQILAKLDHPNIAKILDGGATDDGLPYFVMEFIDGIPITEYCDKNRLAMEQRFRLFQIVCSAVHYAHQHLIVHRDIKPTNILVTPTGTPKLLDFGIAKMLSSDLPAENATVTGVWAMTPEYASPEQFRGEPITTATDIYSLGLILYELLTGHSAHSFSSRMPYEIARVVLESEPAKPSSAVFRKKAGQENSAGQPNIGSNNELIPSADCDLRGFSSNRKLHHRLVGDADNIILKALRKEPSERYASADQLSEDIRRHLEGRPITASKGTAAYRFRKYVVRHKVGVASATAVLLTLITGVVLTLREARIARQNESRAERHLQQARELTSSLIGELPAALDESPTQAKALMNTKSVEYLKQLIEDESTNSKLSSDLALAYSQLAESLGNPGLGNVGNFDGARQNYGRAIDLFEHEFRTNSGNLKLRYYLAHAYLGYSLTIGVSDVSAALEMRKKALRILLPDDAPADTATREEADDQTVKLQRQETYELIGEQYGDPYFPNLGNTSKALEYIQRAITLAERLHKAHPDTRATQQLYYFNIQMAAVLWARGKNNEALQFQNKGEAILDSISVKSVLGMRAPQSQLLREERAMAMTRRGALLLDMGRLDDAQGALDESRQMLESLFWNDSLNYGLRRDLARNYNSGADTLARKGNLEKSLDLYRKALALSAEVPPIQPGIPEQHADSYEGLGNALLQMGNKASAIENCTEAMTIRQLLAKSGTDDARSSFLLAKNYVSLAHVLAKTGDRNGATSNLQSALKIQESLATKDPSNALVARDLASTRKQLRDLSQK